jgi:acetoin utilization deacetylase AcuC-like enzyme
MPNFKSTYFGDFSVGDFFYGTNHPMKPFRLIMLQDLIWSYGIQNYLNLKYPKKFLKENFKNFHSSNFLDKLSDKKKFFENRFHKSIEKYLPDHILDDCPILSGLKEYCQRYSGASLSAALELNKNGIQNTINWSGGLHHGKIDSFSGFCYTNDIVLAILELLRNFRKILYIDIDVHHGDGVEEAFYLSKRVFTLSFHHFGRFFFPESGNISNRGIAEGKNYSMNIPFDEGLTDHSFEYISIPLISKVIENFNPSVIVLQSGADSLSRDKLGVFNLSILGHSSCINFLKKTGIPLLVLGGGGYIPENVVRCWTFETSLLINKNISNEIPYNNFWEYLGASRKLFFPISDRKEKNSKKELSKLKKKILQNIKFLK